MHVHMNVLSRCTITWTSYHDARWHERLITMHGHMNVLLRCCTVTWTSYHDAQSHERLITILNGHLNVLSRCTVPWTFYHDARSRASYHDAARSHKRLITVLHGHMNVLSLCTITWKSYTMHGHMNVKELLHWELKYKNIQILLATRIFLLERIPPALPNTQDTNLWFSNCFIQQLTYPGWISKAETCSLIF